MNIQNKAPAYGRPEPRPYVRFELRPTEDRGQTSPDGISHMIDVPWAVVSAAGSRDTLEKPATEWIESLDKHAQNDRIPREWPAEYREAFRLWKLGQEMPLHGTPIKSWPPLSPAQRKNIIDAGVLTIEALAGANDEVLARVGMGAQSLRQIAKKWLEEASNVGVMSQDLAAANLRLEEQQTTIANLSEQVAELLRLAKVAK